MTKEKAEKVILENYNGNEGSLTYSLYEDCCFSIEHFWTFYDSIIIFVGEKKNHEITRMITHIYQRILKEMIYHFDSDDVSNLADFPENYNDYLERIDCALLAYYTDNIDLIDDSKFSLPYR